MRDFFARAREPVNCLTHFAGLCLSALGGVLMLGRGIFGGAGRQSLLAAGVFCLSLSALYAASSGYHFYQGSEKTLLRLRKLDHCIIYVLIAGTYTPVAFYCLAPRRAGLFLGVVWGVAAAGIAVKLFWIQAPRWLYTSFYLLMGWAAVFDLRAFARADPVFLALIAAGGISYSIGAVFYIARRPCKGSYVGFHEIFHIFILIGSLLHYLAVFFYAL
jgi:hemolysin III